jgi:hypothetical protein
MIMGAACPAPVAAGLTLDPKFVQILIATGLLAGALLVGAFVVALFDRWRKRRANETFTAHDQLASFRLLYERGELSKEEHERIRARLLERLKATELAANADEPAKAPTSPPAEGAESPRPPDEPVPPETPKA